MEEKDIQEKTNLVEETTSVDMTSEIDLENHKETKEEVAEPEVSSKSVKKEKKSKKENPQESYEGLTDDEIYTKMQTEKLVQRKKRKRIITSVGMGIAFALAFVIIILATVPVNLKPSCIDNSYEQVKLYNGTTISSSVAAFGKEDERFDKFKKVLNKSFAQSTLSGLFSGAMFAYEIEENHQTFNGAMDEFTKNNTYFIGLTYSKERKVTKKSGRVYYSDRYATRNWSFSFTEAYIQVNNEGGFRNTRIVIPVTYPGSDTDLYAIVITVKANTNRIYDAWSDFVN